MHKEVNKMSNKKATNPFDGLIEYKVLKDNVETISVAAFKKAKNKIHKVELPSGCVFGLKRLKSTITARLATDFSNSGDEDEKDKKKDDTLMHVLKVAEVYLPQICVEPPVVGSNGNDENAIKVDEIDFRDVNAILVWAIAGGSVLPTPEEDELDQAFREEQTGSDGSTNV